MTPRTARIASLLALVPIAGALIGFGMNRSEAPLAPMPRLRIDPQRIAVAGFSSGAVMAQQFHLAFSDKLVGAVLLSGPPYGCAQGSLDLALSRCIKGEPEAPDAAVLAREVQQRAARGELASLDGLAGDRVLALHGKSDTLVATEVARASLGIYEALPQAASMQLRWDGGGDFAHVWPTTAAGGDCNATAPPYIGRCGRDLAQGAMQVLFDAPSQPAATATGELALVGMPALPDGAGTSLDEAAFLYRPARCTGGNTCGLLIAFHGCEQERLRIGDAFARDSGFNRWADAHDVVVLYPQARSTYMPLNPKACWDWWGYSGPDYDTRSGRQLRAVAAAAAALGAPIDRRERCAGAECRGRHRRRAALARPAVRGGVVGRAPAAPAGAPLGRRLRALPRRLLHQLDLLRHGDAGRAFRLAAAADIRRHHPALRFRHRCAAAPGARGTRASQQLDRRPHRHAPGQELLARRGGHRGRAARHGALHRAAAEGRGDELQPAHARQRRERRALG
jgi:poly(3-hydroxybutyrate) depolymerase